MLLRAPLTLASGLTLPNRLAKASTSERLADPDGGPSEGLIALYRRWGAGGAGLLLTGNVIVDRTAPEAPRNVIVEDEAHLDRLRAWADAAQEHGARLVMQLSHAGRQSPRAAGGRAVGPSAIAIEGAMGAFARPRALEDAEIVAIVERCARAAAIARAAGFAAVQIHAAHGYLISQFLSPRTNPRTDRWGGSLDHRMRLLLEIVRATRAQIPSVMVKLNSADFQRGGFEEDASLVVAEALAAEGIDLLEISGGNYESTAMFGRETSRGTRAGVAPAVGRSGSALAATPPASTRKREAYFLEFVEKVRARTKLPLMLTGGFRTAAAMTAAIASGAVDVVGMARPLILEPELPRGLLDGTRDGAAHDQIRARGRLLDDLLQATWYARQLRRLAQGKEPDPKLGRYTSILVEGPRAYL